MLVICAVATGASLMLLQSFKMATVIYVLGIGGVMLILEPFLGLLNYLIFLYIRPQEFIPGFKGLPIMLMLGGATLAIAALQLAMRRRFFIRMPHDYILIWFFADSTCSFFTSPVANTWCQKSVIFSWSCASVLIIRYSHPATKIGGPSPWM